MKNVYNVLSNPNTKMIKEKKKKKQRGMCKIVSFKQALDYSSNF